MDFHKNNYLMFYKKKPEDVKWNMIYSKQFYLKIVKLITQNAFYFFLVFLRVRLFNIKISYFIFYQIFFYFCYFNKNFTSNFSKPSLKAVFISAFAFLFPFWFCDCEKKIQQILVKYMKMVP